MNRIFRPLVIFLIIVIQSALAITVGIAALSRESLKAIPADYYVGELHVGDMQYSDAALAIDSHYAEQSRQSSLHLVFDEERSYEIPFAQIEADVNGDATVEKIKPREGLRGFIDVFQNYFGQSDQNIKPIIKFNEGKLRAALLEIAKDVNVAPSSAEISVKDGVVVKKAETYGKELNIENVVMTIHNQIMNSPWEPVILDGQDSFVTQTENIPVRLKDYEDIQQVFAEYSVEVTDEALFESVEYAVETINGVVLEPINDSENKGEFSFVELLKSKNAAFENDNEGYDQVASALYATLLYAGVPTDSITRIPHKLAVDYIEPGLDAWISGNAGDMRFTNPFKHKTAIFAQLDGDTVKVSLAGNMNDKKEDYKLEIQIIQTFAPPVYNIENNDLKPGEKIVLTRGKEGMVVNILRNGELIGTDRYEAEKAIIQIGPETDWKTSDK